MLSLDTTFLQDIISESDFKSVEQKVASIHSSLFQRTCPGSDFLGWLDLPFRVDEKELASIQQLADEIRSQADCLLVIGIGGSYLGARAVIEALTPALTPNHAELQILYAGHHLSADYTAELMHHLNDKSYYINVISKSGTTTEPGVAFRILHEHLMTRSSDTTAQRIIATTDAAHGALRALATAENYRTFIIPDDVGGR
ncbi:glucose-6-phosphate isomerase, partial [candidate division KSB1 bacterium]|nr:glucose-6-phosphate isomerase [candidate division KSB1 bacterium]